MGVLLHVSDRSDLAESVVSVGLAKTGETIDANFPLLQAMSQRVRQLRVLGRLALDMVTSACGDSMPYIELGNQLVGYRGGLASGLKTPAELSIFAAEHNER